jgi:hypothetical protein
MRTILILITAYFLCISCGIKNDPEYKSQQNYIKKINLV